MRVITYRTSYTGTYIYVPVPGTILFHKCAKVPHKPNRPLKK